MEDPNMLGNYMDLGAFNGGSEATFMYFVGGPSEDQAVLVCVTMRGDWETNYEREDSAIYCAGNGFDAGVKDATGATTIILDAPLIEKSDVEGSPWLKYFNSSTNLYSESSSDWDGQEWVE
jgi:hypothetical protein